MKKIILIASFIAVGLVGCSEDPRIPVAPVKPATIKVNNSVNNFTWKAMNSWYNWQEKVPNLADSKVIDVDTYHTYLNNFNTPQDLFNSLLFQYKIIDRFSWFIEDYDEQFKSFQGISKSFGMIPTAVQLKNGYVVVIPMKVSLNSPASKAGIRRGDYIIGMNNQLFEQGLNFNEIIKDYKENTVELIIGEKDGKTEVKRVTITKQEIADNAIQYHKVFDNIAGKKIGYLVYNGFRSNYDLALNEVFASFKSKAIDELILDLRYNGGGSVLSSGYLASMIYGNGIANKDIFAQTVWNKKHTREGYQLPFLDGIYTYDSNGKYIKGGDVTINRVSTIKKLYVITSENTASASEMIINGLRPYMEVITVGTKTYGKNVGSITLFDSPESDYTDVKTANKKHKFAMQPITFQIFNKLKESDYTNGFEPNIKVDEFENLDGFLPFGDENETILKVILNKIKGVSAKTSFSTNNSAIEHKKILTNRFDKEMYFESNFLNKIR